jgi:hypothetical protein
VRWSTPVAALARAGIEITAAGAGGKTIGPSAGAFSIAESGTVAPMETTLDPDILAHVQIEPPNTGSQVPATSRVCAIAGLVTATNTAAIEATARSEGFVFIPAPWR